MTGSSVDPTEDLTIPQRFVGEAKLTVVDGPSIGAEVPLLNRIVVGSAGSCDLVIEDSAISRAHLAVTEKDGTFVVEDLDSRNGTFLGQARIRQASVPMGAVIRVGRTELAIHPSWRRREITPSSARRFGELYGESIAMREVFAKLERAAAADVSVLIEGETGTGKELAARSLHGASARRRQSFVVFDCASVPPNLAESELFGHVRGAFSGAVASRAGAFEQAHGGTLFLDEMGELPEPLQPKLLRLLETGEVRRVGSERVSRVDVRVVAATNRDLHAEVKRGRFRSDLLYRLDVVRIHLPPLRQRPEDIAGLAEHLLMGKQLPGDEVAGRNLHELIGHPWPGNVRELRNVLHRAVTMSGEADGIRFDELVFNLGPADRPIRFGITYPGVAQPLQFKDAKNRLLADFERAYVDALVERHNGNISHAAKAAGLSRKHLYDLLRKVRRDVR